MWTRRTRAPRTLAARAAIISILGLTPILLTAAPVHAATWWAGSCVVSVTVSFSDPLGRTPISTGYKISGSSVGACESSPSGQGVAFGSTSITAGYATVSCDAIETMSGSVPFSFTGTPTPPAQDTALVTGAGSTVAQHWVFPGVSPFQFTATASLAWLDTSAITTCHLLGVSSMQLLGVLTYQDPSVP